MSKLIICVDFDGVVHWYRKGWQDGTIYDVATPGFFDWADSARTGFDLVIYSSRSKTQTGIDAMRTWMIAEGEKWRKGMGYAVLNWFTFANEKPPAFLTIDDRAIQFKGDWSAPELEPGTLRVFKPWNAREG